MKVSQLLHTMEREDSIVIVDKNLPISTMHVVGIFADDDVIHILAEKAVKK